MRKQPVHVAIDLDDKTMRKSLLYLSEGDRTRLRLAAERLSKETGQQASMSAVLRGVIRKHL